MPLEISNLNLIKNEQFLQFVTFAEASVNAGKTLPVNSLPLLEEIKDYVIECGLVEQDLIES